MIVPQVAEDMIIQAGVVVDQVVPVLPEGPDHQGIQEAQDQVDRPEDLLVGHQKIRAHFH